MGEFLNALEEKYRIVVILYYMQGFKTREIAEIIGINQSTAQWEVDYQKQEREDGTAV